MSKRISPTAIGIFVVGSFALMVAAIVLVGSGSLFKKPGRFVCMFQGDVNGLRIGAPVKFKGVQIGTVEEIKLSLEPSEGELRPDLKELRLPVIIGIDREMITQRGGTGHALSQPGLEDLVARGMRAQLDTESLLTGLLFVDLDLHPNAPLNLVLIPGRGNLREIPTVSTNLEQIQKQATDALAKLDRIDLNRMVASITNAADSINNLTGSQDLKDTLASMKQTVPNLNRTITSLRVTLDNANQRITPLVASLRTSSEEANATMKDTRDALLEVKANLDSDSPLLVNINSALEELADTTRSVGELTDYLQRNPGSLVRGKYVPDKDR
ncbi:MAG: MlaD family protein [Candidatus Binatus sp.]|jgi:paraquat-inducible protein B|uniref:MlaD family protein n=1 Tax=Candidatus Binatus sp. TaxID=2811406 RepID=UPI003CB583D6